MIDRSDDVKTMRVEGLRKKFDDLWYNGGMNAQTQSKMLELCGLDREEGDEPGVGGQNLYDLEKVKDLIVYLQIVRGVYVTAVWPDIRAFDYEFSDKIAIEAAAIKAGVRRVA